MSQRLISRSPDLKRLRDEGYNLEVRSGYLLVTGVPYVNAGREVKRGILVSELTLALGDVTTTPGSHQAYFIGEHPCKQDGTPIAGIQHSGRQQLAKDVTVDHGFSAKPKNGGYVDYYHKISVYTAIISAPARTLAPSVRAQTFAPIPADSDEDVFHYLDTASSRAGIAVVTSKLEGRKVAIVGVGGTGSYVLDLVAKTPVKEVHLYDGDEFLQHNAFRAPGAPAIEQFGTLPKKVDYFAALYGHMHKRIVSHPYHITESNIRELRDMDFVFVCIDGGAGKRVIVEGLEQLNRAFVDVGMGVETVDGRLRGVLRTTTSTPLRRRHFRNRVPLADVGGNEDYDRNIQIADLNALNAALAVIKWKKLCGFYLDLDEEHHSSFTIDGNMLSNGDRGPDD